MLKLIFRLFEKRFIRYLNKKNEIKLTKDNLAFAFHDTDGNGYYKFSKELELPLCRAAKIQEYVTWLVRGCSKHEYLNLVEVADTALSCGLKDGKGMANLGYALHEMKERVKMVVHDELFYNILAVQYIRNDEDPTSFSNEIQQQKVEAFIKLNSSGDTFFLAIQESLGQFGLSNISKIQLDQILNESFQDRMAKIKMVNTLLVKQ